MKHLTLILLAAATLLTAACDDSEKLENRIDFSSPYAIEDSDDPIQHRRYELFRDYGVSVFFNDTVSSSYVGDDFAGDPIYRYETIDLNWEFSSQSYGSIKYEFDYLTTPEEQNRALDFVDQFLGKATGAMRPFCMFLTSQVTVWNLSQETYERPDYLTNFRTLVVAGVEDYAAEQMDSLSTTILRSMVKSRVQQDANLVARFGSVSSTENYYGRPWVTNGANDGLGCTCRWLTAYDGYYQLDVNNCFTQTTIDRIMSIGIFATMEAYEEVRAELIADIGRFGFISGYSRSSKTQSPEDVSTDLGYYIDTLLAIGKEEFVNRYGGSELVMEKYNMLVDYIEGELGVAI